MHFKRSNRGSSRELLPILRSTASLDFDPLVSPGALPAPLGVRIAVLDCDLLPPTRGLPICAHTRWTDRCHPGVSTHSDGGQPFAAPDRG